MADASLVRDKPLPENTGIKNCSRFVSYCKRQILYVGQSPGWFSSVELSFVHYVGKLHNLSEDSLLKEADVICKEQMPDDTDAYIQTSTS